MTCTSAGVVVMLLGKALNTPHTPIYGNAQDHVHMKAIDLHGCLEVVEIYGVGAI